MRTQIHYRVSLETRERWEAAAELQGKTLSEFLAQAANESAQEVEARENERRDVEEQRRRLREYAILEQWTVVPNGLPGQE